MDFEEIKELRKRLLAVMDCKDERWVLREKTCLALGREWNLTEEETRQEMLYIRKVNGNI